MPSASIEGLEVVLPPAAWVSAFRASGRAAALGGLLQAGVARAGDDHDVVAARPPEGRDVAVVAPVASPAPGPPSWLR